MLSEKLVQKWAKYLERILRNVYDFDKVISLQSWVLAKVDYITIVSLIFEKL